MKLFCCECGHKVDARLTTGQEVYGHLPELHALPFWICDTCGNYVGCHSKTRDKFKPLGPIPTEELRQARREIHSILDPLWRGQAGDRGKFGRSEIYRKIGKILGREFHIGEIRTMKEAKRVRHILKTRFNA